MKHVSIKTKITIWFSVSIIIIAGIAMASVLGISNAVIKQGVLESLAEVVEDNADEIEFYSDYSSLDMDDDYDLYLEYKGGYLEIDDDFINSVNGISSSIYDKDGEILYGENPVYKQTDSLNFIDGETQTVKTVSGITYFIYDRCIEMKGSDPLWLRGIVSSEYGTSQTSSIMMLSLWIFPILVVISIIGGYLLAKRALAPIEKMSISAQSIREGHDLTKRIAIPNGNNELHSLANSFNGMLDRLENAFKDEQQLTNNISHELRTPVCVIMSQCEFTLEKDRNTQEYTEAVELILRQSRKMSKMINDMLSFARLERCEAVEYEKINFSEIIYDVCYDMAAIKEKNISLESSIQPNITVNGNSEQLSCLAVNLISNAYRYGKENGHIHVSLKENDGIVSLSVSDDGIGIKDSDLEKIWNRFYRCDSSRSEKGTGLGLSFVREIARIHGGTVSVESTPNEGSTFTFTMKK